MNTQMLIGSKFEAGTETAEAVLDPRTGKAILDMPEASQKHACVEELGHHLFLLIVGRRASGRWPQAVHLSLYDTFVPSTEISLRSSRIAITWGTTRAPGAGWAQALREDVSVLSVAGLACFRPLSRSMT